MLLAGKAISVTEQRPTAPCSCSRQGPLLVPRESLAVRNTSCSEQNKTTQWQTRNPNAQTEHEQQQQQQQQKEHRGPHLNKRTRLLAETRAFKAKRNLLLLAKQSSTKNSSSIGTESSATTGAVGAGSGALGEHTNTNFESNMPGEGIPRAIQARRPKAKSAPAPKEKRATGNTGNDCKTPKPKPKAQRSRRLKKLLSRGHGTLNEEDIMDVRDVDVTDIDISKSDFGEEFGSCGRLPARYEIVRYVEIALHPMQEHRVAAKLSHGAYVLRLELLSRFSGFFFSKSCMIKVWLQDVAGGYSVQSSCGKLTNKMESYALEFDVPQDRKMEVVFQLTSTCRASTVYVRTVLQKLSEEERVHSGFTSSSTTVSSV